MASAEVVMSPPIGVNKITCLANSDTIVGVPFRKEGSRSTLTSGAPIEVVGQPDLKEIPLDVLTLEADSLTQHYLHFTSGTRDGRWYDITANTATSVTIDLNGDTLEGVLTGDGVTIAEYWTLNTLFPPDQATTSWTEDPVDSGNWVPNGHAIVASGSTLPWDRKTTLLFPNLEVDGINRSVSSVYYIANDQWYKVGVSDEVFGTIPIFPDMFLTIRHPTTISHSTSFRSSGEVLLNTLSIALHTQANGQRDSLIGLPRPIDSKLSELNLLNGAFMQSPSTLPWDRRDLLLVFDNTRLGINKQVAVVYYHDGNSWLAVGDNQNNRDNDTIPAGSGFIIRKYQTESGTTAFWQNTAPY